MKNSSLPFGIPLILTLTGLFTPYSALGYPAIEWWTDLDSPSLGSAAVADLDSDGFLEIVFGTYFNDESIHCLNAEDGSHAWTYYTGSCNDASPVIHDVDDDGQLEVVVPGSSSQTLYCLDGSSGNLEWSVNQGHCIDSPPAIADVDADGDLEVINGTFNGFVYCIDADSGYIAWECSLGTDSYIQSCPNIHDFDDDGDLEIVVAQWLGDCRIYCLEGSSGDIEWYSDAPSDNIYHGGSFADVDEDGRPEIAIGSYDSHVYLINGENGSTEWAFSTPAYACGPTSIADLNSDGHLEVCYATGSGVGVVSHTGSPIWSFTTTGSVFRGLAVTDIDGDTIPDVVFGTSGGMLIARRGSAGELLWELDLQSHYGNTFDIDHAPVTGDFNNDGEMDVFIVGGYGTSSSPSNNHGRAYMITAGIGDGDTWSMFRHDRFRSGYFDLPEIGVEEDSIPSGALQVSCSPNPCGSSVEVRFLLESAGEVTIELFDLSGRTLRSIDDEDLPAGENLLDFDTSSLSPGIYFFSIRSADMRGSTELIVIR